MDNIKLTIHNDIKINIFNDNEKKEYVRDIIKFKLLFNKTYEIIKDKNLDNIERSKLNELKNIWVNMRYNNDLSLFFF